MTETRDHELGAALRALPVPPPEAGFFDDLRAQLPAVPGRRTSPAWLVPLVAAAAVVSLVVGGNAIRSTLTAEKPVAPATQPPSQPPVVIGPPTGPPAASSLTPGQRLAEEMRFALVHTESTRTVGTLRRDLGDGLDADPVEFGLNRHADGSADLDYTNSAGVTFSVQLRDGVVRYRQDGTPDRVERGLALAAPDPSGRGIVDDFAQTTLGSYVRALVASGRATVTTTSYGSGDRPAWKTTVPVIRNSIGGSGGQSATVWLDQETGVVVGVEEFVGAKKVIDFDVTSMSSSVAKLSYTLSGGEDAGWTRGGPISAIDTPVGYRVPQTILPADLEPSAGAWATRSQTTGAEGLNPLTDRATQQTYGRGLAQALITTRAQNPDRHSPPDCPGCDHGWQDPLAPGEGFEPAGYDVVLTGGDYAGLTAHVVIHPRATPHLWLVRENGLVVTISGDLSEAELLYAANNLHASRAP